MVLKKKKKKKIVLLDAHAILHRAYHALPDFASSKGEPTGALFGLSTMLFGIINDLKPDYIVAAFDLPKPTYRHEVYANYKAGRRETDSELKKQFNRARDLFRAFNIPIYEKEGFEADDVLGTIVEVLKNDNDIDIIISSGDMDTLQLVNKKKVQVYTLRKGIKDTVLYDEEMVKKRYGFGPKNLIDYKGLRGDPSDNIIGVEGIGDKTATTLIVKFNNIENVYKTVSNIKKDNPEYFKELDKDIPDNKVLKETGLKGKPYEDFIKSGLKDRTISLLYKNKEEAEFSKMLATIRRDAPINFEIPKKKWTEGVDAQRVKDLFNELEFRTLFTRFEKVLGVETSAETSVEKVVSHVNNEEYKEVAVALWVLDSNITNPSIEDILSYAGINNSSELKKAKKIILNKIKSEDLDFIYSKIEKPLIPVIALMENNGVKIDKKRLAELSKKYHTELEKIQKEIYKMAGKEFNINSPKQMAEVLFVDLGLKYKGLRKTSSGKYSTKEEVLHKLNNEGYKIASKILEYREYQKLLSTYIDSLPKYLDKNNRLRAKFSQTGTTTGRLSSNDPNLQNIPVGSKNGREIRKAFIAEKGCLLVAFDYSQIELRIAAFLSGDKKMIQAFKSGADIHSTVAAEMFDIQIEDVLDDQRAQAKVINFGILYGMGVSTLQKNLNTDRKTAQQFYNKYFEKFSGLADYIDRLKKETAEKKYTETLFGRKRYFDGFNSPLPFIRAQAERMAINAPIQGTEADLIKIAMVKINEYLEKNNLTEKVKLILQIHDEVILEVEETLLKTTTQHPDIITDIKEIMENILNKKQTKNVPILVKCVMGKNWGELK